jgi:hypothetical protein
MSEVDLKAGVVGYALRRSHVLITNETLDLAPDDERP